MTTLNPRASRRARLRLQPLERREVPATFEVTNLNDAGTGSLRDAVTQLNLSGDATNTIDAKGVTGTIALQSALPTIVKTVSIFGPGASGLAVSGNKTVRVFDFSAVSTASIENLTISNGKLSNDNGAGIRSINTALTLVKCDITSNAVVGTSTGTVPVRGGGVFASGGSLNLDRCTIGSNVADLLGRGGGISSLDCAVTISESTISGNTATRNTFYNTGYGGGLYQSGGSATISKSTFFANGTATNTNVGGGLFSAGSATTTLTQVMIAGNFAAFGAGAATAAATGKFSMTNCTVELNAANNNGGGVRVANGTPTEIVSSTIDFNTAGGFGGGVDVVGSGSPVFTNVTVSSNQATLGGGGFEFGTGTSAKVQNSTVAFNKATGTTGIGGGVQNFGSSTTLLESTIVANNSSTSTTGDDISGTLILKSCLTLDSTGYTLASGSEFNLQGKDPRLDPMLANNGGVTLTHRFLFSNDKTQISEAVDAGSNPSGLTLDQRGALRTVAILDVTKARTGIGAFEYQQPPQVLSVTTVHTDTNNPNQQSNVKTVIVTLNQPITFTGGAAAFELKLNPGSASDTVTIGSVTLEPAGNAVRLTSFSGALTKNDSLVDGNFTLTVKSGETTTGSLNFKGSFFSQGLDGNFDGTGAAASPDNYVNKAAVFRLFGDSDGDRDVDAADFAAFRTAFGTLNTTFDSDGDGDVDATDFAAFRAAFGKSLPSP